MKKVHRNPKDWKTKMVEEWLSLVQLYKEAKQSPKFKKWLKLMLWLLKLFFSVMIKRLIALALDVPDIKQFLDDLFDNPP